MGSMGQANRYSLANDMPRSAQENYGKSDINDLLTQRQKDILTCLFEGMSNKNIARKLDIAEGTVRVHMSTIYRLLGVDNRTQALVKANNMGILLATDK